MVEASLNDGTNYFLWLFSPILRKVADECVFSGSWCMEVFKNVMLVVAVESIIFNTEVKSRTTYYL